MWYGTCIYDGMDTQTTDKGEETMNRRRTDTKTPYQYVTRFGIVRTLATPDSTDEEKQGAAVRAGQRQREEWLLKALYAMKEAGESERARELIREVY